MINTRANQISWPKKEKKKKGKERKQREEK